MRGWLRRFSALFCVLLALITLPALPADASDGEEVTVLFTHDLHSHFLPRKGENGTESGGYARLKTAIDREKTRHPDALLLDGGDFSVGSLIQTLFTREAAELRTMGAMGYDATTIGNHEFDHTGAGFAAMLNAAADSGDKLPALLEANYFPALDNPDREEILAAMDRYGVAETMLLERGGVKCGLFGLNGVDSDECAPTSGFTLEDAAAKARRCVDTLRAQGAEIIICLSHSGTAPDAKKSEDLLLAQAVEGIDVILSGHTHSTLKEPLMVGGASSGSKRTYIISCGAYCSHLGSLTLHRTGGGWELADYHLTAIDETLPEDPQIAALVEQWKETVSGDYLSRYGLNYDEVLTTNEYEMKDPAFDGSQYASNLGELAADAFLWATEHLEEGAPNVTTLAVVADGVLRAPLYPGGVTAADAFDVLSMGVGEDGTSGFPLVGVYLTGKEVRAAMEVDASVTPIMPAAQLHFSGVRYAFNQRRMFFNRVYASALQEPWWVSENDAQEISAIDDGTLYRVVTGMYSAQMLSTVKGKSMGLLSLEPKLADGSPVTDFTDCILRDAQGNEIKEWYALAAYLRSFGDEGIPARYAAPDGRKTIVRSMNPVLLLKGANWITLTVIAVVLALILLLALLLRAVRRAVRRRRYGRRR